MAEDLRKGVKHSSPDSGSSSAQRGVRRPRSRPPIRFAVNTDNLDGPSKDASSTVAELTASDFRHLIYISSAEIGCFSLETPIPCDLAPAEFASAIYNTPSTCLEGNYRLAASAGFAAPEKMLQHSITEVLPAHLGYERMFQEWGKRSLTGQGFDIHALDRAGRQITYHAALYGRIDDERLSRVWVILRDISAFARAIKALGKTEKHYRSLLNTSAALLLRVLPDGTIDYASESAQRTLEFSALHAADVDDVIKSRLHPIDLPLYDEISSERRRGIVTPRDTILRLRVAENTYTDFSLRQVAHISSSGDVDYFDILAIQGSPSTPAPQGLPNNAVLESSATIHDLNNQLLVIRSQLELALSADTASTTTTRQHLSEALDACALASSITLRALGRSSPSSPPRESVNVSAFLESISGQLRALIPPQVSLLTQPCPPHLTLHAHRPSLHQIITNLILNARDAIAGPGAIILAAEELAGRIVCTVSDNGSGMPKEILSKAFMPFTSTKGRERGTGLGLYNVRRLARENDGDVTISSEAGRGTVVSVILPSAGPHLGPIESPTRQPASGRPLTILLADDESGVRDTLLLALSRRGYRVFATPNGASLLSELKRRPNDCDLVIVDDGMPSMSSRELLRQIRELAGSLPVLLTSGDPSRSIVLDEIPGASFFLPKPFGITELYAKVESLTSPRAGLDSGRSELSLRR